ncbi:MAG TPA: hypothetical protein PLU67_06040 [Candidatus Kapabacteria bacterium]|jgi:hypothetical protein|nr:hypothetical protein [Candidatus Kapabacteria bacterium]HOM05040.1 hypothetical protein [Candidatus Kapabacteria bacterium]HPP39759.1 hypothetical protein [Candidatus Kapabacteria bacterium]HPU24453.1 hypothetical protein [Candidatus Kapabacteria bacterium]
MKVTEIRPSSIPSVDVKSFQPEKVEKKAENNTIKDKVEISAESMNWQKDILLSALELIENKVQPDASHPLDKVENRPIETFEEALLELRFLNTDVYSKEALGAQANIKAEDILSLFVEEAA